MHNFHLSPPPDGAPGLHPLLVANEETRALRGSSKYTRYIFTTPAALAPPFSLHAYTLIYLLLFLTPKPRPGSTPTPWMWIYHHTPPAPCFLAIPKLDFEARHPARNGDLCSHRDGLEQAFLHHPLPCHQPSVPPTTLAASWSMQLLPSTPRRPKLSAAKAANLWLRSPKDVCLGRA